jgi:hypothetical protein
VGEEESQLEKRMAAIRDVKMRGSFMSDVGD